MLEINIEATSGSNRRQRLVGTEFNTNIHSCGDSFHVTQGKDSMNRYYIYYNPAHDFILYLLLKHMV
jgi:hypothetical protein